jgi:DNA-directed RNA polymerase subunit K/omega
MDMNDDEPDIFNESDDEQHEEVIKKDTKNENDGDEDNDDEQDEDDDNDNNDDEDDDEDEDEDDEDDNEEKEMDNNENSFSNNLYLINENEEFYDSDSDEEDYIEKFNENTSKETIMNYYPEHLQHNIDEIEKMSIVVRDANGAIIDPLHKTVPFLTKYERARIIGERAKQLEYGSKPFISIEQNEIDSYLIAEKEFYQKAIPFILKRPLPNGSCEYWKFKDLEIM